MTAAAQAAGRVVAAPHGRAARLSRVRVAGAPVGYLLLALLVAGPLLGGGLVLAVDLSLTARAPLPTVYWGLAQGPHEPALARAPLDAVFAGLGQVGLVAAGEQALLVGSLLLAGWGMHRLVAMRTGGLAPVYGGLLYAVNPFVYDRLYTGQWFLLLGYALLPFAYLAFLRLLDEHAPGPPLAAAALAVAVGIANTHMAVLLALLCGATVVADAGRLRADAGARRRVALAVVGALLPSLYWLVPTPGLQDLWHHVGDAQLELYRTAADPTWGLVATVAGLSGYWNDAEPVRAHLAVWPLFAATFAVLAAQGAWLRRRDPATWGVVTAGALGFLLALGVASGATRGTFTFLLDHVPALRSFRESQKGVALVAFAYAYLGGPAAARIPREASSRAARALLAAVVVALPLLAGYRLAWGLWGEMHTSAFPASWSQADARLHREATRSRTLFLPWHGYLALSFAHHRVVANPAPAFFSVPILASRSVGDSGAADNSDPVEERVAGLLSGRRSHAGLAEALARLGVSHVLLAKQADWRSYGFLDRTRGVAVERRWADLVLYRIRPSGALLMDGAGRPLRFAEASPARYRLRQAPPRRLLVGLPDAAHWRLRGEDVAYDRWPAYLRNYLLGLGGLAVVLLAGVLPAARRRRHRRA